MVLNDAWSVVVAGAVGAVAAPFVQMIVGWQAKRSEGHRALREDKLHGQAVERSTSERQIGNIRDMVASARVFLAVSTDYTRDVTEEYRALEMSYCTVLVDAPSTFHELTSQVSRECYLIWLFNRSTTNQHNEKLLLSTNVKLEESQAMTLQLAELCYKHFNEPTL